MEGYGTGDMGMRMGMGMQRVDTRHTQDNKALGQFLLLATRIVGECSVQYSHIPCITPVLHLLFFAAER